jgi:cytoskeleton protein RodZ
MEPSIGETLREARIRRRIDLTEVEAATKIRARYLRALENDEWDVLPGGAYTRSFIRTYAGYLGLDGERLADEFRRSTEDYSERVREPVGPAPAPRAPRTRGDSRFQISRGALAALISVGLIVILIGIGLAGGGGGSNDSPQAQTGKHHRKHRGKHSAAHRKNVTLRLSASADVWVCLLNSKDNALINGQILTAGSTEGPFRSGRFTVSFGNGEVAMEINGKQVPVQPSPNPVGYEIRRDGKPRPLSDSARPTCT